jgi:hypothetical protein
MKTIHANGAQLVSASSNVNFQTADGSNTASVQSSGLHLPVQIAIPGTLAVMSGFIEEISLGAASLVSEGPIDQETVIRITRNDATLDGEVIWCRPDTACYRMNVLVYDGDESGKRRAPRFPVELKAHVHVKGTNETIKGQIVDVSSDGLGLEVPISLRIDETTAIETESCITFGLVRYCRRTKADVYRIGIAMQNVMPKRGRNRSRSSLHWIRALAKMVQRCG